MPDRAHQENAAADRLGSASAGAADRPGSALAGAGTRAIVAASIVSILFFLIQILTYGYGRDQGIYAIVARSMLDGGMPYKDAFDFKPPGVFLVFALARALLGPAQWAVRALEVAGLLGMTFAMMRLAERWWGERRIGLLAGALAILVHAQLDFWHTAQPESFGGMITMFALLAATPRDVNDAGDRSLASLGRAVDQRPSPRRLLGAGALFGLAGLFKPPLAGGGAVLALALGWVALRQADAGGSPRPPAPRRIAAALRPVGLVALGGALPLAACAVWFAAKGALADLYQVLFVFTPPYTALGWRGMTVLGLTWYAITDWLVHYSGPLVLGLGCLLALHPTRRERLGVALLAGIIAMHLTGVMMQAKFFPYHYGATWPPTAMLAALGLWKAWDRCAQRGRAAAAGLVAAFAFAAFARSATKDVSDSYLDRCISRLEVLADGARDQVEIDRLASVADVNAAANRAVAAALRDQVDPGSPVFIWGFEPVIYDLADLPASSRYLYNVPQRVPWAKDRARADLMRDLSRRPPAAIVVEARDVFPMVTDSVLDSRDTLDGFPELNTLLDERYEPAIAIEDFEVFVLRDDEPTKVAPTGSAARPAGESLAGNEQR